MRLFEGKEKKNGTPYRPFILREHSDGFLLIKWSRDDDSFDNHRAPYKICRKFFFFVKMA